MADNPELNEFAALIADPVRARILRILMDGTARPTRELAYMARISAQSAGVHLTKLVEGGLLSVEAQGRHRYFRSSSPEIAVIAGLASSSTAKKTRLPPAPLPTVDTPPAFLRARTCYGHLAGAMAVSILDAMLTLRWLSANGRELSLTPAGEKRLTTLGVDVTRFAKSRRVFARTCIDLTQRRPHLSGALGDALLDAFVAHRWVVRSPRSRVVKITSDGRRSMRRFFHLSASN